MTRWTMRTCSRPVVRQAGKPVAVLADGDIGVALEFAFPVVGVCYWRDILDFRVVTAAHCLSICFDKVHFSCVDFACG